MFVSFNFLVAYIIGGLTLFPLFILSLGLCYVIYSRIIFPIQSLWLVESNDIDNDDCTQPLDPIHKESEETTPNQLYKIGWLKVSRDEEQALPDASIGDMVKSYISGKASKKESANIYFAVLKYSTLYLYDSEKQLDSKGVIMLNHHTVTTHPPDLQDFELFSKPHLIKLVNKEGASYYINCNRCIDKEDWFFAFIKASKLSQPNQQAQQQDKTHFDQSAMNHLITMVHSDQHHFQTQWLNAILGRIFFGVYRTKDIKEALYKKIVSKLDKINAKRPPFLGEITVRSVDPGHALPRFTQPKLLGLSPTGELSAEAHLQYDGGFRVEIETVLKWKYSDLLRPLTIDLVLGITLKEIEGKFLMKIKEPPTNRFWYGFYECPKMEWKVEPVVWEKRVGYSVVVKAIETKIQEFIMETMVLPNFDDITFFPTNGVGGIFEESDEDNSDNQNDVKSNMPIETPSPPVETKQSKKTHKKRHEHDEALLTTAKSLPELFSAVPERLQQQQQQQQHSKLRTPYDADSVSVHNASAPTLSSSTIPIHIPSSAGDGDRTTIGQIAISNPNNNHDTSFVGSLSSSPDSLSSSPSSCTMDDSLPTLTHVITDDTMVSPPSLACDTQSTIQITYSQDYTSDTSIHDHQQSRLRKSSSLALLRPKTGASTAINVSPAMAHKVQQLQDKKDIDSVSVSVVSL
ncbi:putative integral membrane protein conserved region-domain-containing protein [Thamnidium elegans]|nr:putative integral membrane protein conserved region-domain-containing protein [Thamnidium elegans]